MGEISKKDFREYDKIKDTIIYFSKDVSLKFVIPLSYQDRNGNRVFFYKEYQYDSKYKNYGDVVSVNRHIKYYLTIEDKRILNGKGNIIINESDMPMLRSVLSQVANWLMDGKTFKLNRGKRLDVAEPISNQIQLGRNSALLFEPTVITYDDSSQEAGVRMSMGDTKNFVDISVGIFMQFYEFTRNFNMYTAACAAIASIPMSKEDAILNRQLLDNVGGYKPYNDGAIYRKPAKNFFDTDDSNSKKDGK